MKSLVVLNLNRMSLWDTLSGQRDKVREPSAFFILPCWPNRTFRSGNFEPWHGRHSYSNVSVPNRKILFLAICHANQLTFEWLFLQRKFFWNSNNPIIISWCGPTFFWCADLLRSNGNVASIRKEEARIVPPRRNKVMSQPVLGRNCTPTHRQNTNS